ncbi:bifunctional hydroxymethylpyrimidine kinase/phosphomethylpyrimidine kinase [Helcococcus ovis]|uniref:Hydroxymethylpyrimidine/phosphomethylpyrimidine kinase n=1 Tax=Helcococcus ovis TaxID=72026 RepID=A0A4R9C1J0_9FIRM|nr:bifunctional hydroxymethylpyrimidine kinase/phosphomethylpyrimidine kinase [Helcococcus ovis]TFF65121.1 bifunctional hydroxymethylpyrimidine kinase/phosphomethylpyrimidine kinase [Helcococcus ovis]TFF66364.1 bifunctional hydroxymethylpyrimidine kinase/phosphomethylpyrimidine kinase [Helcococcus ovis]
MKKVLTIAGVDPIGGAGMMSDIKTMTAHDVYGMCAITLLSIQNTIGFYEVQPVESRFLEKQIDVIFSDIIPDATKTGMLLNSDLIKVVAQKMKQYNPKNLVIDPVMIAHRKFKLIDDEAIETLIDELIPLADLITPNIGEGEILAGITIENKKDMETAAKIIYEKFGTNVVLKSGVSEEDADDLLYTDKGIFWIKGEKVDTKNTRGTGDALSSSIASNLAKGYDLKTSVKLAKKFVYNALSEKLQIGRGVGSIHHSFEIKNILK